jgi:hypothetical protein
MNADPQPLVAGDHAQGTTDRAGCCQTGTSRQDTDFSRPAAQHVNPSDMSNILNFILFSSTYFCSSYQTNQTNRAEK